MRVTVYLALLAARFAFPYLGGSDSEHWSIREQETIQKTLALSGPPMRLVIDNVDGYVHVTSTSGSQVRVTAHKVIRAETDSDLQEAKSEVKLEMTEKPGTVSIYYDAPWRCNGEGRGCHGEHRHFYNVTYDIEVEVPRSARTVVSTINNGDIRIDNTDGNFDVSNINGAIRMTGISGAGDAHTINGALTVRFAKNPSGSCNFKTLNGALDVYLRPNLSADLLFKTFNGQIYSDFEVTPRAMPAGETEQRDGKFIYRSRGARGGRVGSGGPELSFDAFNGNIRLHREQ
jgi:hypothetical protein